MIKNPAIFFLICIFIGCESPVTFDQPQPPSTHAINKFPRRLYGKYLSTSGNSTIIIKQKNLIEIYDYDIKIHKDSLPSQYKIKGDTLYKDSTNDYKIIRIENDSIIEHINHSDTLFSFKDYMVLKKYKGHYFLNFEWGKNAWVVKKLTLVKGILSISDINTPEEISILNELTETPKDTMTYDFKTSKKQFKQFLKLGGFKDSKYHIKIN